VAELTLIRKATPHVVMACFVVMAAASCKAIDGSSAKSSDANELSTVAAGDTWPKEQQRRQDAFSRYLEENRAQYQAFQMTPVGSSGIPAALFRELPKVFPDLWGPAALRDKLGMHPGPDGLPRELRLGHTSTGEEYFSFSCATCHTGVVRIAGIETDIPGAPSNTLDLHGYRHQWYLTVNDPRFSAANLPVAAPLVEAFKNSVVATEESVHHWLGSGGYRLDPSLLEGGVPGVQDAFGLTVVNMLVRPAAAAASSASDVSSLLPAKASLADIMSVWQQGKRHLSQWDGSISARLFRNLGAELGVMGNPQFVDFANARLLTPFVAAWPAPVYPFAVDRAKASAGEVLFTQSCRGCHDHEALLPLGSIGTDPGRALVVTPAARTGLIKALKASCVDPAEPDCQVTDDEVLASRPAPGYVALPLAGIWARAPYLHNGSVPTLFHLLVPASRPAVFQRGSSDYDQDKVGFVWTTGGKEISTHRPGLANSGHADPNVFFGGHDFANEPVQLEALLEYLKTL